MQSVIDLAAFGLATVAFVLTGAAAFRWQDSWGKRPFFVVLVFGLFLYAEYFVFGPASYINFNDEGDYSVPLYKHITSLPDGAVFTHAWAGGNDLYSAGLIGKQYFSVERWLISVFPSWIAVFLHKAGIFALGIAGAYLLVRRVSQARRPVAVGSGILFAVLQSHIVDNTFAHGPGHHLLPWALLVIVAGVDHPHFWRRAVLFALLAMLMLPTHILLAVFFSVVGGAVLFNRTATKEILRMVGALAIIGFFSILNWHEVLWAIKDVVPYTARGVSGMRAAWDFQSVLAMVWDAVTARPGPNLAFVVAMVVLIWRREKFALNVVATVISLALLYALLLAFPWEIIGLGFIKGVSFGYGMAAIPALTIPMVAVAATALEAHWKTTCPIEYKWRTRLPAAVVVAGAVAGAVVLKVDHAVEMLYYGGQAQYSTIDNLNNPTWAPPDYFRVVTLRHRRPEPSVIAGFYDLDTFDGLVNLAPLELTDYWRRGIIRGGRSDDDAPRVLLDYAYWDETDRRYDIDAQLDLGLLGAANVRFILSPVPLKGGGVVKVSGPEDSKYDLFRGLHGRTEMMGYVAFRMRKLFHYGDIYIYELPRHMPRVYAAKKIASMPLEKDYDRKLELVRHGAFAGVAVLTANDAETIGPAATSLRVNTVTKTVNGFDVSVAAPDGGVLLVNVPYMPFWRADIDGAAAPIVPANVIQMAVRVPPGADRISLRYARPLLRDRIATFLGAD